MKQLRDYATIKSAPSAPRGVVKATSIIIAWMFVALAIAGLGCQTAPEVAQLAPSETYTPSPSLTPTLTPTETATDTLTPTATATRTATKRPTRLPTETPRPVNIATPTLAPAEVGVPADMEKSLADGTYCKSGLTRASLDALARYLGPSCKAPGAVFGVTKSNALVRGLRLWTNYVGEFTTHVTVFDSEGKPDPKRSFSVTNVGPVKLNKDQPIMIYTNTNINDEYYAVTCVGNAVQGISSMVNTP